MKNKEKLGPKLYLLGGAILVLTLVITKSISQNSKYHMAWLTCGLIIGFTMHVAGAIIMLKEFRKKEKAMWNNFKKFIHMQP